MDSLVIDFQLGHGPSIAPALAESSRAAGRAGRKHYLDASYVEARGVKHYLDASYVEARGVESAVAVREVLDEAVERLKASPVRSMAYRMAYMTRDAGERA
ncbi:MAG: hypothetical protein JKY65_13860 [Planctomycetes bacterium]|nr:hypothetical protein [Planctomycetota bacterium]